VLVGFRTLFGALGLLVILWSQRTFPRSWKDMRPWLSVFAVVGLINVALPFVLISWSEQYISSGIASILNSTVPLFTMLPGAFGTARRPHEPAQDGRAGDRFCRRADFI